MVALTGIFLALSLMACGRSETVDVGLSQKKDHGWSEFLVPLDDGREITCLVWSGGYAGGPSCDWGAGK